MKTGIIIAGAALIFSSMSLVSNAQELPQPSPAAKVKQRIGLTDIKVEYSRPSVKGRTIWGDLVPYDEVWRTGANKNTILTFSEDVKINGKPVAAGSYSLFTIPGKDNWKIIINKDTEGWGTGNYKAENNVLSYFVKGEQNGFVESMMFYFDNVSGDETVLYLAWDKVRVPIKIAVNTDAKAKANIDKAIADLENVNTQKANTYRSAARYYAGKGENLDQALEWINKSIELNDIWYSHMTKAEVLYAKGDKKGAVAEVEKAGEMGRAEADKNGEPFAYQVNIDNAIKKYKQ